MWCSTTAFGVILLPAETLGVLSCFSRNLAALGNFGLDATAFGVVGGTLVQLAFDQEE